MTENRLDSTVVNNWGMVRFDYNALGKPVRKVTRTASSGWVVDSYYIWDGDQLLLELDASGNRRADYVYFPGTIDQPAAETIGVTSVTAIRDHRMDAEGNVTGTVDGVAVSQKVSYDAWGTPTITGNSDNRLLWKGLMWEGDDVSLYFVRNRWYDPELGRFMNEDPIGHAGGENLYTFGGNDPINGSDPSGMVQCTATLLAAGYHQVGDLCVMDAVTVTAQGGPGPWLSGMSGFSNNFGNRGGNPWAPTGFNGGPFGEWLNAALHGGKPLAISQGMVLKGAINRLLNSTNSMCRALGVSAFARMQRGGYYALTKSDYLNGSIGSALGNVYLSPALFRSGNQRQLVNTVAHEEFHYHDLLGTILWNDQPGRAVYQAGDACQAAAF